MNKKTFLMAALLLVGGGMLRAQEAKQWTLQECISYALEHNISLQQNRISFAESEVDVKSARSALFPNLSFGTGHNIANRPYQENSNTVSGTEIISSNKKTTYNGNYGLNAQWTLWDGNKKQNSLKQRKTSREMASLSVKETENNLQEQIIQLFVQILYSNEAVKVNAHTLEVSEKNYARGEEMLRAGMISKVELAQLESQMATDKYQLLMAQNTLRDYKLQLKQLLELEGTDEMNLLLPELSDEQVLVPLPLQADVYRQALNNRPEIKREQLNIESSRYGISIAKAGKYPTLSLSASTGSNTNSASSQSWGSQMKYGWNNMIGLQLNIPIFDNRQSKSALEKARLQMSNSQLELEEKKKALYQTIETLWHNAHNAQQEYLAAEAKMKSSRVSFELVNEEFNLGMKNMVDLLTEKTNLLSAEQQRLQAKYMAILDRMMLKFYAGESIQL